MWAKFLQELTDLKEVRVQRLVWSGISGRQKRVELHGFSDSSEEVIALRKCVVQSFMFGRWRMRMLQNKSSPFKNFKHSKVGTFRLSLVK